MPEAQSVCATCGDTGYAVKYDGRPEFDPKTGSDKPCPDCRITEESYGA